MVRDELSVLSAFLAVAEERSFTRAAKRLNVSKSGLSHAIRRLEEDVGVRLLARTTRSVSPTNAGEQLLASRRARRELDRGEQSVVVAVNGSLILDDLDLVIQAAIDAAGLAFMAEDRARPYLQSGALERILDDWSPPFPGFFLYYPSRRQQPAALTALIETLRFTS